MPPSDAGALASAKHPSAVEPAADAPARAAVAAGEREANAAIRASSGLMRTRAASQRDAAARVRDIQAAERDQASAARERWEASAEATPRPEAQTPVTVAAMTQSAERGRSPAASEREHAASDRAHAAEDRARAADDRRQGRIALRDAHLDELTGVYTRGPGLLALQHEVARAHRSSRPFVLALVDIDGLRRINARDGHEAGDAMLRAVATQLCAGLRSYDVIVRVGGDEFVCAFSDTSLPTAARRIRQVQAGLPAATTISAGMAQLSPGEMLDALTARADAELERVKRGG